MNIKLIIHVMMIMKCLVIQYKNVELKCSELKEIGREFHPNVEVCILFVMMYLHQFKITREIMYLT